MRILQSIKASPPKVLKLPGFWKSISKEYLKVAAYLQKKYEGGKKLNCERNEHKSYVLLNSPLAQHYSL